MDMLNKQLRGIVVKFCTEVVPASGYFNRLSDSTKVEGIKSYLGDVYVGRTLEAWEQRAVRIAIKQRLNIS